MREIASHPPDPESQKKICIQITKKYFSTGRPRRRPAPMMRVSIATHTFYPSMVHHLIFFFFRTRDNNERSPLLKEKKRLMYSYCGDRLKRWLNRSLWKKLFFLYSLELLYKFFFSFLVRPDVFTYLNATYLSLAIPAVNSLLLLPSPRLQGLTIHGVE